MVRAPVDAQRDRATAEEEPERESDRQRDEGVEIARRRGVQEQREGDHRAGPPHASAPQRADEAARGHRDDQQRGDGRRPREHVGVQGEAGKEHALDGADDQPAHGRRESAADERHEQTAGAQDALGETPADEDRKEHDRQQHRLVDREQAPRQLTDIEGSVTHEDAAAELREAGQQHDGGERDAGPWHPDGPSHGGRRGDALRSAGRGGRVSDGRGRDDGGRRHGAPIG